MHLSEIAAMTDMFKVLVFAISEVNSIALCV